MNINLIVAMTPQRVIGINNQLPWHMSADLQYFKKTTMGKPIIMGRKTYQSIGKPLPGRKNIIITRDKNFNSLGCEIYHSLDQAFSAFSEHSEIFVIGGAELFQQTLSLAQKLYITYVYTDLAGDAYFPEWSKEEWQELCNEKHSADEKNPYAYAFVILERVKNKHYAKVSGAE